MWVRSSQHKKKHRYANNTLGNSSVPENDRVCLAFILLNSSVLSHFPIPTGVSDFTEMYAHHLCSLTRLPIIHGLVSDMRSNRLVSRVSASPDARRYHRDSSLLGAVRSRPLLNGTIIALVNLARAVCVCHIIYCAIISSLIFECAKTRASRINV